MGGGGGEFSSRRNFFSFSNSFLAYSMNIFLGLIGVHEFFFSCNFPLREYFFCTSPAPASPPISFVMAHPLKSVILRQVLAKVS